MKRMYEGKTTTNPKQFKIGCVMYEAFSGLEKQQYMTLESHYITIRRNIKGILKYFTYSTYYQEYILVHGAHIGSISEKYLEILGQRKNTNE